MKPNIGDMIHFRKVCAACNKMGRRHFTFVVNDPELLYVLPEFSTCLHTYDRGRRLNIWLDHSPSLLERYKMKFNGVLLTLSALIGSSETHGYEDTRLIVFGGEHVFLMGPSRDIAPLTTDEVQNPTITRVASRMNIEHFNYIDLRARHSEKQTELATSLAAEYRNELDFITKKRVAVQGILVEKIAQSRREFGLNQLIDNSALASAALSTHETLMTTTNPSREQIQTDFQKRTQSVGYPGSRLGVLYDMGFWPLDAGENVIAQDILGNSLQTAVQDYWEDWSIGLSQSFIPTRPKEFLLCLVIGLGLTDGNALVTNYINRARVQAGVQPLEINDQLRTLARGYITLYSEPDRDQFSRDMEHSSYAEAGWRIRYDYSGVYVPRPKDFPELSIHAIAKLIADGLLRLRGDTLLRSDWQHIGIAVNTGRAMPPKEWEEGPRVPSMMAEYVIAWRLPPDTERPPHFPPPIHDSQQTG